LTFREFPQNPIHSLGDLETDIPQLALDETGHALEVYQAFPYQIDAIALSLPLITPAPLGLAGFAGLAALTGIHPVEAPAATPHSVEPGLPSVAPRL
jgi:hypothetical protein